MIQIGSKGICTRRCQDCELSYAHNLVTNKMSGVGAKNSVMFIGKHPGAQDDKIGEPMTGNNGQMFYSLLLDAGFTRDEIYVTNCIKCAPIERSAVKRHWDACSKHLLEEIEKVHPVMLVAVGAESLEMLTGRKGIQALRGTGLECTIDPRYQVFPMRQPMALEHTAGHAEKQALRNVMVEDLVNIRRVYHSGGKVTHDEVKNELDYRWAETEEDVVAFLEELDKHGGPIACDIETTGLDAQEDGAYITAIGFSCGAGMGRAIPMKSPGESDIWWWDERYLEDTLKPTITKFLMEHEIFGFNWIKFDAKWLRRHLGIDPPVSFDVMLAAAASIHGLRSFELEVLANSLCGMPRWKNEIVDYKNPNTPQLCRYLCKDVDATFRLRTVIEEKMSAGEKKLLSDILVPVSYELGRMEETGVLVDRKMIGLLDKELTDKANSVLLKIRQYPEVCDWETNKYTEFNPGSPQQVREILFEQLKLTPIKFTKGKQPSADAEVMNQYAQTVPLCQDIISLRKILKLKGTYVDGITERLRKERIHTSYKVHWTATGRLSSENPNLQNIPRGETASESIEDGSLLKAIFRADPGRCFLQVDYSQAELRVLASLSNDSEMIRLFNDGADLHRYTAASAYDIPEEEVTKEQRTSAKAINFGVVYGMQLEGLSNRLKQFGIEDYYETAKLFLETHKKQFPGVWDFMDEQEMLVKRWGKQTTPFGRTRKYEEMGHREMRQAYNFPIQSCASDVTLCALIESGRKLRELKMGSWPILTVHDSIVYSTKIEEFWKLCRYVKYICEHITFDWLRVPMKVDLEAGPNWGKLLPVNLEDMVIGDAHK